MFPRSLLQAGLSTSLDAFDYTCFHAPYNKLVQKSFARVLYNDFLRAPDAPQFASVSAAIRAVPLEQSYDNVDIEKAFVALSKAAYARQAIPTTLIPTQLGNIYTASLFAGLLSLIATTGAALRAKRVLTFAYGSGLASSLYSFTVADTDAAAAQLDAMQKRVRIAERLAACVATAPADFDVMMQKREQLHHSDAGFEPTDPIATLVPGSFYLVKKDDSGRRAYAQVPWQ